MVRAASGSARAPGCPRRRRNSGWSARAVRGNGADCPSCKSSWHGRFEGTAWVRTATWSSFVGGGSVNGRHRYVVQSQVDTQLAAVMDDVAEDEGPERGDPRQREHLLPAAGQRRGQWVINWVNH